MISLISFSIRILLSALLWCSTQTTAVNLAQPNPEKAVAQENVSIVIISQMEAESGIIYEAILKDTISQKELGRVVFSYNKYDKTGYIARLHILREERKHSYGSKLLNFALQKLSCLNCNGVFWQAYPFDLRPDQTPESMLPKLIAFYKRHGAEVLSQNGTSAQMAYYPAIMPQAA